MTERRLKITNVIKQGERKREFVDKLMEALAEANTLWDLIMETRPDSYGEHSQKLKSASELCCLIEELVEIPYLNIRELELTELEFFSKDIVVLDNVFIGCILPFEALPLLPEHTEVWASEILFTSKKEKTDNPLRRCEVHTKKLIHSPSEPKVLTCLDREGFDTNDPISLPVSTIGRTQDIKGAGVVVYIPQKGERQNG